MSPSPTSNALDSLEQVYAADRAAWRRWLAANHGRPQGIWLVFDKKSSRTDRLAYGDAVEEALCYGWIDSTVRPLDDARYVQLFAPRKPKSTWSRSNKERVERLLAQGLMAEPGLASIERAKANGSWSSLDEVEALVMPDDLAAALAAIEGALEQFAAFSPSARKGYLHWVSRAVRPETRAHRVREVVAHTAAGRKSRHFVPTAVGTSASARTSEAGGASASGAPSAERATRAKSAKSKSAKSAKSAESAESTRSAKSAKNAESARPTKTAQSNKTQKGAKTVKGATTPKGTKRAKRANSGASTKATTSTNATPRSKVTRSAGSRASVERARPGKPTKPAPLATRRPTR